MRILYGVVGEGMGHATRSRVILEELVKEHEVQVVASGRAHAYLAERFPDVHRIWGFTLHYEGNAIRRLPTVLRNLRGAVGGWPHNVREYFRLVASFRPDAVVSDFESFSYYFGKAHGIPVIDLDNIHVISRCRHSPELLRGHEHDFGLIRNVVAAKLPRCFHYVIPTFFYPPLRARRTTLVPPVLRPEILAARAVKGEHLLVYQTATTNKALPETLKRLRMPARVYGLHRDLTEDLVDGNVTYRPFSETRFIDDLCTARAVVAGGGFTLLSEAVYLRKPVLSVPVERQFEQVLNALYLQELGYGRYARRLDPAALEAFLAGIPEHERALAGYSQDGNAVALATVKEQLAEVAARRARRSRRAAGGRRRALP
ncbi:MAG TPA: MJ1255/VC2487 family glycosyltransferase [Myxococcaceae bacterium]|nr:MJ1255/VC2487 family glycosyltransferase [Myxococcaceae bacterium]